jgi:hypothetical protein
LATCLLATRAIANASQNRSADDLKLDFTAAARGRDALIRHFASLALFERGRQEPGMDLN